MQFGVCMLPEAPWEVAGPRWQRGEELGFAHAWTYDHLTWRSFRDAPWYAAVPTLAAAAMATSSIRLGTLVASPNFRHPLVFVKDLLTLDDICGGRLIAGIGAGGEGWDASMLGQPRLSRAERAVRFAEFVELTDLLLRQPATTWKGRYFEVLEGRTYPGSVQSPRVPLAIAASGPAGMALAARFGEMWVTTGDPRADRPASPEAGAALVGRQISALDEACLRLGRDPTTLRRLVLAGPALEAGMGSAEEFSDTSGRYGAVGVTDFVVHWPRPSDPYQGDLETFEEIFVTLHGT